MQDLFSFPKSTVNLRRNFKGDVRRKNLEQLEVRVLEWSSSRAGPRLDRIEK